MLCSVEATAQNVGIDLQFIETVAKAGCFVYLDGISVHPYRAGGPESVLNSWDELQKMIDLYWVPSSASGNRRPRIVSGEWGWASCTDNAGVPAPCTGGGVVGEAVTRQEQATIAIRDTVRLCCTPFSIDWGG